MDQFYLSIYYHEGTMWKWLIFVFFLKHIKLSFNVTKPKPYKMKAQSTS